MSKGSPEILQLPERGYTQIDYAYFHPEWNVRKFIIYVAPQDKERLEHLVNELLKVRGMEPCDCEYVQCSPESFPHFVPSSSGKRGLAERLDSERRYIVSFTSQRVESFANIMLARQAVLMKASGVR